MNRKSLLLIAVLVMAISLVGCEAGDPSSLVISPESTTINLASGVNTAKLEASVRDEEDRRVRVEGEEITWAIDGNVAILDATTGDTVTVVADQVGEAKAIATYGGVDASAVTITVIDEEIMPESGVKAPKVAAPLALGEDWAVDEKNAYSTMEDGIGWNVWVLWDDANVYLQYDVYTDFPLANTHTEHQIWNSDSIEWEVVAADGTKEKWILGLTDNGYEIVTRHPRIVINPGEGVDVVIKETDFGYRGQAIFDQTHEHMAKFNLDLGSTVEMAVQINDSADGVERTRILGGFVDAGVYTDLTFMYR